VAFIQRMLERMEYVNRKVFVLLTIFFRDYVISQKERNKMNAYNLAVIFGPCFFRPKEYDLKDLMFSGKFAKVLVTIFEAPEDFISPAEIDLARGELQKLIH
jgi:Rho GTPase-activating protein 1